MQFTTNYDLNKPDLTDKFEVEHQNQNMDIIDGEMKSLENNKANRAQEAWITPSLVNGWVPLNLLAYNTFQYMKDEMGFVHTRGLIKSGTTGVICTLPAGYRPLKDVINPCVSNNAFGRVDISATGVVTCVVYDNAYVSLQGISFKAEQ